MFCVIPPSRMIYKLYSSWMFYLYTCILQQYLFRLHKMANGEIIIICMNFLYLTDGEILCDWLLAEL